MVPGVTMLLRRIVICIFRCSPILSLREPSPDNMARIALLTGSESALFVVDKTGVIAWSYCSPVAVNPGADGILQALENLPK